MALTFSLFHRPGSVLFLDDDTDYLTMLGMVLPAHWQVELYAHASSFAERMRGEAARWEADAAAQLQMMDRWRQGQPLLPQVLRYWGAHPERHRLVRTCVIDYAMPDTNGLRVLGALVDWPGSRVLLTGQADEQIAVQAFNSGLIDQFVPKQAPDITSRLLGVLRKLAQAAQPRLHTLWRAALRPVQQSLLQSPSVAQALQAYTELNWVEYVVLGEPFGLLGLDVDGQCHWLQLEPAANLADLAELARSAGLGLEEVQAIQSGQRLAAVELHQQLGLPGPVRSAPALSIGDDGALHGAVFTLEAATLPLPLTAYRDCLDAQRARVIKDP